MGEIISLEGVSKSFKKNLVLNEVNLKVNEGDILGVLGRSGSGKSVLLKILMGFSTPSNGMIEATDKIGFSTQANSIYEALTTEQNLDYFAKIYRIENKKERIDYLLKLLHLEEYRKIPVKKLSGGTKKRIDIACALLDSPQVLVLDEPFVGLDSFLVNELINFLKLLQKKGTTIILSSHLLHQVENLCNRYTFIENGKLQEINKNQLKSLYGVKST